MASFTYGEIHLLLLMHFIQSSSNQGEIDFLGLWTGACMARIGSAEKRTGMRGTKESERRGRENEMFTLESAGFGMRVNCYRAHRG